MVSGGSEVTAQLTKQSYSKITELSYDKLKTFI
jgi:hypothetical protein